MSILRTPGEFERPCNIGDHLAAQMTANISRAAFEEGYEGFCEVMPSASQYLPMRSKPVRLLPPGEYLCERKHDGIRMLAGKDEAGVVELVTRGRKDLTPAFPELAEAVGQIPFSFVLDSEACVLVNGQESLGAVISRSRGLRPSRKIWKIIPDPPAVLMAFDLLKLEGEDCCQHPIEQRKAQLKKLLPRGSKFIRYVEHTQHIGTILEQVCGLHAEGIVLKKAGSRYVGRESDQWLKFKFPHYQPLDKDGEPQP